HSPVAIGRAVTQPEPRMVRDGEVPSRSDRLRGESHLRVHERTWTNHGAATAPTDGATGARPAPWRRRTRPERRHRLASEGATPVARWRQSPSTLFRNRRMS